MFTGLVEDTGDFLGLEKSEHQARLYIGSERISDGLQAGDSVAVNGCCLTAVPHEKSSLAFDLLTETLARTNLGQLRPGSKVNLERALPANGRLGGHFVQGHVDCTTRVSSVLECGADLKLQCALPPEFAAYVVWKGSICINGVSLTIAELSDDSLTVWIIPHTRTHTNLGALTPGAEVNLEFDILAKYAERILTVKQSATP